MGESRVIKHESFRWDGVAVEAYESSRGSGLAGVTRQVLLGAGGEALGFVTRYFELEPGASSSLEHHAHSHSVVVLRGRGEVLLGGAVQPLEPFDCVYVAPDEVHQFRAAGDEPLGFLCIVDRGDR